MIRFFQVLAVGLLVFSCNTDNKECSIPKIIKDSGLEKEYSQAIEDWYKINYHIYAKNGGFLVAIDSIIDSKIWIRDTTTGHMNINRDLTSDYMKMIQKFPNKIFKYNEVNLILFSENIDEIVDGDTLLFTLFPEITGGDNLIDFNGGYVYNLFYVRDTLLRVGERDYTEWYLDNDLRDKWLGNNDLDFYKNTEYYQCFKQ